MGMQFEWNGEPLQPTTDVYKIATWVPVTDEALADAPWFSDGVEYMLGDRPPLTLRERVTGYRHWQSRRGATLVFAVGWRAVLYGAPSRFRRWLHDKSSPHGEYCPDEDDY